MVRYKIYASVNLSVIYNMLNICIFILITKLTYLQTGVGLAEEVGLRSSGRCERVDKR